MPRRSRARRNPLGLSKKQSRYALYGVGGAALVGAIGYLAYRRRSASAATGPSAGSCWQPLSSPYTLVPGHYRFETMFAPSQGADMQSQWTQMVAGLAQLQQVLPSIVVEGIWYGSFAYPKGAALPSDWPTAPDPTKIRVQLSNAYSAVGTPYAGKALPASVGAWSCSTGPVPAAQALPANIATLLAQLASMASGGGSGGAGAVLKGGSGGGYVPKVYSSGGYTPKGGLTTGGSYVPGNVVNMGL